MSLSLIDTINEQFIQLGITKSNKDYKDYLNQVTLTVNKQIKDKDKVKKSDITSIVNKVPIKQNGFDNNILLMMVLSAVTLKIFKSKKSDFTIRRLKKINEVIKFAKPNRPVKFTKTINELTNAYLKGEGEQFKGNKKKAFEKLSIFYDSNKNTAKRIKVETLVKRNNVDKLIKSNLSKNIYSDYKTMISKQQSLASIERKLIETYDNPKRVKRIIDTETHALAEQVKVTYAKSAGLTHKIWRTQGDSKVRDLPNSNHKIMNGVRIEIDDKFDLQGHLADGPGDITLPANQRIGCRCYLTFN